MTRKPKQAKGSPTYSGMPGTDPAQLWQTAVAAFQAGNPARARKALKPILKLPAADGYTFLLAGMVEASLSSWRDAETWLRRAVKALPDRFEGWLTLGNVLSAQSRMEDAFTAYREAARCAPDNPEAWNNLGAVAEETGRTRDALEFYENALKASPEFPQAMRGRATALARLRRIDEACAAYKDLIHRFPKDPSLILEYARLLEQANRPDESAAILSLAGNSADKAVDAEFAYLKAQLLMRDGQLESALELLGSTRRRTGEDYLAYREGLILDRLGRFEEAMAAFHRANGARAGQKDFQRLRAQPLENYLKHKLKIGIQMSDTDPDPSQPRLAFVTGLPRSGTTLLDRMLDAHPDVQVLEELEGLRAAESAFAAGADPQQAREAYWDFIKRHVELRPNAILVDKNPIHVMYMDYLPRLFPGAPLILALRHPYDAALSCYMQDFDPGPVTARFLNLRSTGALSALWLRLMAQFESAATDSVIRIRYEDLVQAPEAEITRILEMLQLDWRDEINDFAGVAARSAPILTASYEQVTRGIYKTAVNRWHHYRQWLSAFDDTLGESLPIFQYEL